jgi:hypothetical protein
MNYCPNIPIYQLS